MSKRIKTIVKTCAKCHKPFSTADDNITLCRECMNKDLKAEAAAELARQNTVAETRNCKYCGKEFTITVGEKEFLEEKGYSLPNYCPDCRKALKDYKREHGGLSHICKKCGNEFKYSVPMVLDFVFKQKPLYETCMDCHRKEREQEREHRKGHSGNRRNEVYATATCRDCGKEFVITVGEHDFLVNHGYENMPVRCRDCRHKRQVNALVTDMRRMGEEPVDTIITSDEPVIPHANAAEMVPDISAMPEQTDIATDNADTMTDVEADTTVAKSQEAEAVSNEPAEVNTLSGSFDNAADTATDNDTNTETA